MLEVSCLILLLCINITHLYYLWAWSTAEVWFNILFSHLSATFAKIQMQSNRSYALSISFSKGIDCKSQCSEGGIVVATDSCQVNC